MSSGVTRNQVGAVIGTGAAQDVRTIGFRPRTVRIFSAVTQIQLEWQEGMADDSGLKTVAAGTRTFVTSGGITPLSNGFSVGDDSTNIDGDLMRFEAGE